jgi:hypothetical protein
MDFITFVTNISQELDPGGAVYVLIWAICYLMALGFAWSSVFQLKEIADEKRYGYKGPLFTALAAVIMAAAPSAITTTYATFFGSGGASPLSYVGGGGGNPGFVAVMRIVSVMGYVFFIRGVFLLRQSGDPQRFQGASAGKAATVMIGGMLAIYIDFTIRTLASWTGWNVSAYLN